MSVLKTLDALRPGEKARVVEVRMEPSMLQTLEDLGIFAGAMTEVYYEGPLGRDPMAVFVRGSLIAIRRADAKHIHVTTEEFQLS